MPQIEAYSIQVEKPLSTDSFWASKATRAYKAQRLANTSVIIPCGLRTPAMDLMRRYRKHHGNMECSILTLTEYDIDQKSEYYSE